MRPNWLCYEDGNMKYSNASGFIYFWLITVPSIISYLISVLLYIIGKKELSNNIIQFTVSIEFGSLIFVLCFQFVIGIFKDFIKWMFK